MQVRRTTVAARGSVRGRAALALSGDQLAQPRCTECTVRGICTGTGSGQARPERPLATFRNYLLYSHRRMYAISGGAAAAPAVSSCRRRSVPRAPQPHPAPGGAVPFAAACRPPCAAASAAAGCGGEGGELIDIICKSERKRCKPMVQAMQCSVLQPEGTPCWHCAQSYLTMPWSSSRFALAHTHCKTAGEARRPRQRHSRRMLARRRRLQPRRRRAALLDVQAAVHHHSPLLPQESSRLLLFGKTKPAGDSGQRHAGLEGGEHGACGSGGRGGARRGRWCSMLGCWAQPSRLPSAARRCARPQAAPMLGRSGSQVAGSWRGTHCKPCCASWPAGHP